MPSYFKELYGYFETLSNMILHPDNFCSTTDIFLCPNMPSIMQFSIVLYMLPISLIDPMKHFHNSGFKSIRLN